MSEAVELQQLSPCEICKTQSHSQRRHNWRMCRSCPRCGTFEYDLSAGWRHVQSEAHAIRLSGWVRDQNDAGIEFVQITWELFDKTREMSLPTLTERATRLLKIFAQKYPSLYNQTRFGIAASDLELWGRSYSNPNTVELKDLFSILNEQKFVDFIEDIGIKLSVKGLLEVESMRGQNLHSKQGFVAMAFDSSLNDAYTNGFYSAVKAADFQPLRIDAKDYLGGVSDEIIAEIRRSRFVVADYTLHRGGVYFEAGFALGLGLPVIPTCRQDGINDLHFDIKHLNTLVWTSPEDLANRLEKRIRAVITS